MRNSFGILLAFLLAGCASPFGYGGLSSDQLKEISKVKDSAATCVRGVYAGAMVTLVAVSTDKGIAGTVTIDENCKTTLTTIPPVK